MLMTRKKSQRAESFLVRMVELISDPRFVHFENLIREPNIFQIVGRTHYERWHSAFWGWLLDPSGSHLLQHYGVLRLLYQLFQAEVTKPRCHCLDELARLLPAAEFTDFEVLPNERNASEISVSGVGRFDVLVTGTIRLPSGETRRVNVLIELKIEARTDFTQSRKYANWLFETHPDDINLPVYFLPELEESSTLTTGDERWFCVSYQSLHDNLLVPLLEHPNLNAKARPFIVQYVKNLRIPRRGIKMAITEEEKQAALALYERYSEVFDAITDVLVANGTIEQGTSDAEVRGRASGRIAVRIGTNVFSDTTVRLLFEKVLKHIVDDNLVARLPLPWGTSSKRFILTNETEAIHPNGRPFFYPAEYKGYTIETHCDRERAMIILRALCEKLGIEFDQVKC